MNTHVWVLLISPVVVASVILVKVLSFGSLVAYWSLESKIAYWLLGSKHVCDAAHSSLTWVFLCIIGFMEPQWDFYCQIYFHFVPSCIANVISNLWTCMCVQMVISATGVYMQHTYNGIYLLFVLHSVIPLHLCMFAATSVNVGNF